MEIWAARGNTFSPASNASTLNICIPPTPIMGSTAMAMTTIPKPPSHCKMARHSKIPGGAWSRPVMTVEPVVVMPDMASKKASV